MPTIFGVEPGRSLSYTRRGSGPLVVCVPGGPGMDPEAYFHPLNLPGHELLVFAPRGVGASSRPPGDQAYLIGDYVSDLEALRVHLGLERLTLYGNSHGGCTVLAYAIRYPHRVQRFAVTNAPHTMDDGFSRAVAEVQSRFSAAFADGAERLKISEESWPAIAKTSDPGERQRLFRRFMDRYVAQLDAAETEFLDRLCSAPMNFECVDVMYREFTDGLELLDGAERATAPALIVACEYDVTVPAVALKQIAEALPSARYFEFAQTGHFPEVERSADFTALILDFVSS